MCLEPLCASERQSLVKSPRQRCVGEGCGRQARSCRDVFAKASQAHAAMPVRELHLHPFLIRETCYTDDVDSRVCFAAPWWRGLVLHGESNKGPASGPVTEDRSTEDRSSKCTFRLYYLAERQNLQHSAVRNKRSVIFASLLSSAQRGS